MGGTEIYRGGQKFIGGTEMDQYQSSNLTGALFDTQLGLIDYIITD